MKNWIPRPSKTLKAKFFFKDPQSRKLGLVFRLINISNDILLQIIKKKKRNINDNKETLKQKTTTFLRCNLFIHSRTFVQHIFPCPPVDGWAPHGNFKHILWMHFLHATEYCLICCISLCSNHQLTHSVRDCLFDDLTLKKNSSKQLDDGWERVIANIQTYCVLE